MTNSGLEPDSDQSPLPGRSNRKAEKHAMYPILKFILIIGLLLLLSGAGYAGYLYYKLNQTLDNMNGDQLNFDIPKDQKAAQKPMVVLLLGLDTREETRSLNTDVIMAVALHPKTKSATLLSLPRDTYMKPEGYKGRKVNAFYSIAMREDKENHEALVKEMFGDFLDVTIDYVTVINFKTFEDIIDELGGIKVNVDMNMCYIDTADGTHIELRKGYQELNGKEALDFVRYRHSSKKCKIPTAESSDFERNERQQQVLAAMVDKMTSIGGLMQLGGVLDAVGEHVKTDIPSVQMKSFLTTYATIKNSNIEYVALEGEWRSPYIRVSEEDMTKAKQKLQSRLNGETMINDAGTP
jgi:LCP family protein required for cell wall assembly